MTAAVKCVILDRPNPNGFYVDGNILDTAYSSFVGMHPVPIVHGMTVGEYAMMVNGEGWLKKWCQLRPGSNQVPELHSRYLL